MNDIKLSERKQRILRALIDNYIYTAEPISSKYIKDTELNDVSSATIRGELVALEEMGYLVQPHISAGRVPSSKAYRYYVDNLMSSQEINANLDGIRDIFANKIDEVEEVIRNTAKIISDITNYTSMIVLGGVEKVTLKEIKLVDIADDTALVIIITDSGVLKDKVIDLPHNLGAKYFVSANEMLNSIFAGKTVGEITNSNHLISEEISEFKNLFDEVLDMISSYCASRQGKVYLEGANKIFDYKEYENVENVKNFLSVISTKEKIHKLIGNDDDIEIAIKIGKDESCEENMAVVTAKCIIAGKEVGHAAVIGPERMDYKRVVGVLSKITKVLEEVKDEKK